MSERELVVLGTAAQAPTRERNHNGYFLRWGGEGLLFDPGEGTQRQMLHAGVRSSQITRICITHFHGDHCLGLPGVLMRRGLDDVRSPVDVYFPAAGAEHYERLRQVSASAPDEDTAVRAHPCQPGTVHEGREFRLIARALAHRVPSFGWRLEEPDGVRMLPDRLEAAGVRGPAIGRLQQEGFVDVDGTRVGLDEMSVPRPGQRFAFVMDTELCDAAFELAQDADLLVCEATFLSSEAALARAYRHLTAAQAARIAAEAGVRRLVLTHLSQRYAGPAAFQAEAQAVFDDVVVAADLDRIPVPPRVEVNRP